MNLVEALKLNLKEVKVILIGNPEETNFMDSDNKPYYSVKLKNPAICRCSVDAEIEAHEVDEIYIRQDALTADGWEFVNGKDATDGYFMPKWVLDFSIGQKLPIYQETSIKQWLKGSRENKRVTNRDDINGGIRAKMAAKAGK